MQIAIWGGEARHGGLVHGEYLWHMSVSGFHAKANFSNTIRDYYKNYEILPKLYNIPHLRYKLKY
jgi:hypothetical protein